jgi:hypothetical protein
VVEEEDEVTEEAQEAEEDSPFVGRTHCGTA